MRRNILGARHVGAALALALLATAAAAQDLSVTGLDGASVTLKPADIAALPHVDLTVQVEGKTVAYRGVPLTAVLQRVGAPSGKALHGPELADVVIASAADGYTVALALAETDPLVRKEQIILADAAGGQPLPAGLGPYRLVVEGDLRAARSARGVVSLEVRRLTAAH